MPQYAPVQAPALRHDGIKVRVGLCIAHGADAILSQFRRQIDAGVPPTIPLPASCLP